MKFISFKDPNFKFSGMWQENIEGEIVSYSMVAAMDIGFTGNEIEVVGRSLKDVLFYIDEKEVAPERTINGYMFSNLSDGEHTIKIRTFLRAVFHLQGINVEDDSQLFESPNKPYIHYIGDSISSAYPGFVGAASLKLGADFSVVSQGGMALVDGWGWYKPHPDAPYRRGMESNYFGLELGLDSDILTPYKFKYLRIPDIVVIFLGTNDYLDCGADESRGNIKIFAKHYLNFVKKLRDLYPNAPILILQALSDKHCRRRGIKEAFELINENVSNVALIPSHEWEVELGPDNTHPTPEGYAHMGDCLAEVLEKQIKKLGL